MVEQWGERVENESDAVDVDVVVVGAGMAGLYALFKLRDELGLSVRVVERGGGVGGTWYWNRYPGARCDSEIVIYSYTFSEELQREWRWSERYPSQPEILAYLDHVADRFDLRRDIDLNTEVSEARFDAQRNRWLVSTTGGRTYTCQYLVTAVGTLASAPHRPHFDGLEDFKGDVLYTSSWPHTPPSFKGKRVGVIGTGSSGVQAIPAIAEEASHLTVFQRTPNFVIPARNHPLSEEDQARILREYPETNEVKKWSEGGFQFRLRRGPGATAMSVSEEERRKVFDELWADGGHKFFFGSFRDLLSDERANEAAAEYVRERIRERVADPELAEELIPWDHPIGTRRPLIDTGYLETFSKPNVSLVNIRRSPIQKVTATGIETQDETIDLDVIVFATGFDAITGPLLGLNLVGADGTSLAERWSENGAESYLAVGIAGFPNLFTITGVGNPITNMIVSIEHHVEWIAKCIKYMNAHGFDRIEPDPDAQSAWMKHLDERAENTLYPRANSWYNGANIPGKAKKLLIYLGSFGVYRKETDRVADNDYEGFLMSRSENTSRELQADGVGRSRP